MQGRPDLPMPTQGGAVRGREGTWTMKREIPAKLMIVCTAKGGAVRHMNDEA